ncbi:hypothetical protein RJ639_027573 [Escallonia herrerae]|uniref:Uncharacterized protein n=1 Tax=Escallonia herrerae TaxID=1293975 RepID=A0AA88X6W6_9ASTE|nr:hypothetical protein RJ639_027573 [Escallonia herrerae]
MLPVSALSPFLPRRLLSKPLSYNLPKPLSTHSYPPPIEYTLSHPIYIIWGANTSVGKTLVSAGLAAAFLSQPLPSRFIYIKPLQTGFPSDSDSHFVYRMFSHLFIHRPLPSTVFASNQTLKVSIPSKRASIHGNSGFMGSGVYEERKLQADDAVEAGPVSELICKTMYGWREAVSPHLAVEREGATVDDSTLLDTLMRCLRIGTAGEGSILSVIETAGGVASPAPSGSLQCDYLDGAAAEKDLEVEAIGYNR